MFKVEQKRNIRNVFTDVKCETRRFTMIAQKQFECYISEIEELAEKSECYKPHDIAESIIKRHGIAPRDLKAVFVFLTGSTLNTYIRERQMMAAYKAIISSEKFNAEIGISITGYSDQSAFIKAFKQRFGMTPKEAFEKKDLSKYLEKLTWDALSKDAPLFEKTNVEIIPVKMKFGISEEQYQTIIRAADLQALFDLDDSQSEIAFELAKMLDIDMNKTFEYVAEYCFEGVFYLGSKERLSLAESSRFMRTAYIYFNVIPNVCKAQKLIDSIDSFNYKISDFSFAFLRMYVEYSNLPIRRIVDWAEDHNCDICTFEDIEEEIQKHIDDIVEDNLSYKEALEIFCPDFNAILDDVMSDMQQDFDDDYIDIKDEERDQWNNSPDEFSKRLSEALENDSYYDDYDTDGQYFDF